MFLLKKRIYFCDTDAEGIVYHSRYLDFFEHARTEFLISRGMSQVELTKTHNIMFVINKCEIEYKTAARFEELIGITVDKITIKGPFMFFEQSIINLENNKVLVTVIIKSLCVNQEFKLVKKLPEILINAMKIE